MKADILKEFDKKWNYNGGWQNEPVFGSIRAFISSVFDRGDSNGYQRGFEEGKKAGFSEFEVKRNKKHRQSHTKKGLCVTCGQSAVSKIYCQKHLELHNSYSRAWEKAKREGKSFRRVSPSMARNNL
jgi:hypothetical protein